MNAREIIALWKATPNSIGVADDLRCAAMECQEDYPEITVGEFAAAAEEFGYKASTARVCWYHVKRQETTT